MAASVTALENRRVTGTSRPGECSEHELIRRTATAAELQLADQSSINELLKCGLNWQRVSNLAHYHGTVPLLLRQLTNVGFSWSGNPFLEALEHYSLAIARNNAQLAEGLLELIRYFSERAIEIIPYKGPLLAIQAYGNLSLRTFQDLDIIVAREQVPDVQKALFELGFNAEPRRKPELPPEFFHSSLFRRLTFEQTFSKTWEKRSKPTTLVDLHWEVAPPYVLSFEFDYLLRCSSHMEVYGDSVRTLSAELLMIILCAHGTKHQWREMRWVVDLAELMRRTELDWNAIYEIAGRHGIARKIDLGLLLCTQLPTEVLQPSQPIIERILKDEQLLATGNRIVASWFGHRAPEDTLRNYWGIELRTFDSTAKSLSFILNELFQPSVPDYIRFRIPERMFGLYHVFHPVRLATEFVEARLQGNASRSH